MPEGLILDEVRLRQILFNLVGNSIRFTHKGYIKIWVSKNYTDESEKFLDLSFSVEDNGTGIGEERKREILNAFKEGSASISSKYGGAGLGLCIINKLINMMGGEFTFRSEEGKGSLFSVVLRHVEKGMVVEKEEIKDEWINSVKFKEATLLLVDDVKANVKLLKEFLSSYKFKILEAENGKAGIDLAIEYSPDLIVLDMKMPVMSGYEVMGRSKEG